MVEIFLWLLTSHDSNPMDWSLDVHNVSVTTYTHGLQSLTEGRKWHLWLCWAWTSVLSFFIFLANQRAHEFFWHPNWHATWSASNLLKHTQDQNERRLWYKCFSFWSCDAQCNSTNNSCLLFSHLFSLFFSSLLLIPWWHHSIHWFLLDLALWMQTLTIMAVSLASLWLVHFKFQCIEIQNKYQLRNMMCLVCVYCDMTLLTCHVPIISYCSLSTIKVVKNSTSGLTR